MIGALFGGLNGHNPVTDSHTSLEVHFCVPTDSDDLAPVRVNCKTAYTRRAGRDKYQIGVEFVTFEEGGRAIERLLRWRAPCRRGRSMLNGRTTSKDTIGGINGRFGFNKSSHSLTSGDPDRGAFVAYFLGAVVPLAALAFVIGRYTTLRIGMLGQDLGYAPLGPLDLLALFASISSLSLACFFLLRKLVKRSIEENRRLAQFDTLTGLPNRNLFKDRTEQALLYARREGTLLATCFLDLDGFKRVNDLLGHAVGDELLRGVANRLVGIVRLSDSVARGEEKGLKMGVARLGGDEFTLLLTGISDASGADRAAQRVVEAMRAPFQVAGHELVVTASLGIAIYPVDGDNVETLLMNADTAMYCAKDQGRNNFQFFSASMNDHSRRKLELEARLRGALSRDDFSVHYQPVRDARTGQVVAAEALIRWADPELGVISPAEFIPVAEDSGLIDSIGEWVLRTACAQSRAWQACGLQPIRMAVNLSGHQVRQAGFVESVARVLQETKLSAAHLELEITESTIMQDDEQTDSAFQALADMGIGLALDDFGTGYSSLTYLRRFPISRVKIDRSFVEGIPNDAENLAVTAAIIAMAHHLLKQVVGEGVETQEQAHSLCELGCDELQGYLVSPAVPAAQFLRFLDTVKTE
jgi:diguanylate cyclase (GGDEF)-like protein